MATRSEAIAPTWKEGSVTSWLTTVDHKRIGILYIVTSFVFFGAAGVMAMLMRIQLSHANSGFLTKGAYNEVVTMHGTAMVFLFVVPGARRVRQLPRPAHDRREGHGLPAPQRRVLLALPPRRARAPLELPRRPGRRPVRLDLLHPLLVGGVQPRTRPGPLDPRHPPHRRRLDPRLDQLHRHDPQHARSGHDLDAHPALHVGDRGLLRAPGPRPPDDRRGRDAPAPRPPGRHDVLRAGGRRADPLAAHVLVLRAPRGLHHGAARDGDHLGGHPGLLAQADLRLQGRGVLDHRHRLREHARVGAPHVHGRDADVPAGVLRGHLARRRRADRR